MPGEQSPNKPDDIGLSIEDLFAEAVAAVEAISVTDTVALETSAAAGGMEIDVQFGETEPAPEPVVDEEVSLALEKRASRRAKLKNRLSELERTRDEAVEQGKTLRTESIRLKATNQRLRERLDRLQTQNDNLNDARQTAEQQVVRFHDAHRKTTDDLKHFQERRRQEKIDQKRHGQSPTICAVLPVLDHLEMAIAHANAEPEKILQGVQMVISQFQGVLRRLGAQRVPSQTGDQFQPELHEAMLHTPSTEVEVGHILQEISSGYTLNGRLLRAARVSVAAAVASSPAPIPGEESEVAQIKELFTIPSDLLEE